MKRIEVSEAFRVCKTNVRFEMTFDAKIDMHEVYKVMENTVLAIADENGYYQLWLQDLYDCCEDNKFDIGSTLVSNEYTLYVPAMLKAIAEAFPSVNFEAIAVYDDQRCFCVDEFTATYCNHHLSITERFDDDESGYFCPECGLWLAPSWTQFDADEVVCDDCEEIFVVSNLKYVPPFVEVHEYEI